MSFSFQLRSDMSYSHHEGTQKDSEIIAFQFSSFVLFATFVVKYLFRFLVAALPRWGLRGGIPWLACFFRLLAE